MAQVRKPTTLRKMATLPPGHRAGHPDRPVKLRLVWIEGRGWVERSLAEKQAAAARSGGNQLHVSIRQTQATAVVREPRGRPLVALDAKPSQKPQQKPSTGRPRKYNRDEIAAVAHCVARDLLATDGVLPRLATFRRKVHDRCVETGIEVPDAEDTTMKEIVDPIYRQYQRLIKF